MAPNPGGMRDDTITVIVLASESERVVLWHCACHPVGFPNSNQVSSDYPGEIRRRIREIFNNETAVIFLQGFCGDVRPNTPEGPPGLIRRLALGPSFGKFSIDDWNQWAGGIADAVEDAIVRSQAITVGKTTARMSQAPLGELLVGAHQHLCVEFQLVMLFGQIPLIVVSAEPVIELSMLCPVSGALFVGYSRDVFGYWPRTSQLKVGGYEVTGFRELFGVPYPWVSDPDSVFVRMFRQVTAEVGCCDPRLSSI
jgi:hypothetical protein